MRAGWTRLAAVDTRGKDAADPGGQYAAFVADHRAVGLPGTDDRPYLTAAQNNRRLLADAAPRGDRGLLGQLSADDRRLWRLVAAGTPTVELATTLHVSERTAKRLVAGLLRQLRVSSRTEAAA